jgi:hypothetical protein
MDDMTAPAHARPRRDSLLPVLVLILAGGLLEVWASWLQIGAVSGFPHLGPVTTGWILPVTAEAYWGAALWAWLVDPAGRKSRLFAMCSAAAVFVLSLAGQESDHLMAFAHRTVPPVGAAMLLTALPLTAVASGAILIHLRQVDHAEAAGAEEAARKAERAAAEAAAAADERTALREHIEAQRDALSAAQSGRDEAQKQAAEAQAKADALTRKLAAAAGTKGNRKPPAKRGYGIPATKVPRNVDVQAEALAIIAAEPDITGEELAARVGRSERWGQTFKKNLAPAAPKGQDPEDSP